MGLIACGSQDNTAEQVQAGTGTLPPTTTVPWTPGPTPPPADPTTGYKSYQTTSGGHFKFIDVQQTTLPSGTSFQGFTARGEHAYVLVKTTTSGISRFEIRRKTRVESTWTSLCSWLDDGRMGPMISIDGGNLHMFDPNSQHRQARIRRWSLTTCASLAEIPVSWSYAADYFFQSSAAYFAANAGLLWFSEHNYSQYRTSSYSSSSLSFTTAHTAITVGTASFRFDHHFAPGRAISATTPEFWGLSTSSTASGSTPTLWRRNTDGTRTTAWAYLPDRDFPHFGSWQFPVSQYRIGYSSHNDREYLAILLPRLTNTLSELNLYWADVTNF